MKIGDIGLDKYHGLLVEVMDSNEKWLFVTPLKESQPVLLTRGGRLITRPETFALLSSWFETIPPIKLLGMIDEIFG